MSREMEIAVLAPVAPIQTGGILTNLVSLISYCTIALNSIGTVFLCLLFLSLLFSLERTVINNI